jgi:hypothetical protein
MPAGYSAMIHATILPYVCIRNGLEIRPLRWKSVSVLFAGLPHRCLSAGPSYDLRARIGDSLKGASPNCKVDSGVTS